MSDGWQHKDDVPDVYFEPGTPKNRPRRFGKGYTYKIRHRFLALGLDMLQFQNVATGGMACLSFDRAGGRNWINSEYDAQTLHAAMQFPGPFFEDECWDVFEMSLSYKTAKGVIDNCIAHNGPPNYLYYNGLPSTAGHVTPHMHQDTVQAQQKQGNILMDTMEMITIMQLEGGAKVVRCRYMNTAPVAPQAPVPPAPHGMTSNYPSMFDDTTAGTYCFKNVVGLKLKKGDIVMAETRDSYSLLEVVNADVMATDVGCPLGELKHIVATVQNDAFLEIKEKENVALRQLALSEVTSKLDVYKEQVGSNAFNAVAGVLGVDTTLNALQPEIRDMSELMDEEDARREAGDGGSAA